MGGNDHEAVPGVVLFGQRVECVVKLPVLRMNAAEEDGVVEESQRAEDGFVVDLKDGRAEGAVEEEGDAATQSAFVSFSS